jgi:hypothetical protein
VSDDAQALEWYWLRVGLVVVAGLVVAALAVWGIQTARYEDVGFLETRRCLVEEKGLAVRQTRDLIARTADRGALDVVVEGNPVTVSVASSVARAERIAAAYRQVGGELGPRLEVRGRTVYFWEAAPTSPQLQTMYECHY